MRVYYFGCWNSPGHYLHSPGGRSHFDPRVAKYGNGIHVDGSLAPRIMRRTFKKRDGSWILSGARCWLGQGVYVGNDVAIGDNVKIQNNVSVYDAVTLEDDVFCGPSMVFTNVFDPRAAVSRKAEYRRTLVRQGATLGANCTIVCGTTVGEHAFVGAGSVVNRDVPDFALMVGVPAKQVGWMSRHGERLPLPIRGDGEECTCPITGERYRLSCGQVQLVEARDYPLGATPANSAA